MEFNNDSPIYLQIIEDFKNKIIAGDYNPGDKVPSVRELSMHYEVNPNTVQKALTKMEYDNIVYAQRTSGRFIREDFDISSLREHTANADFDEFIQRQKDRGFSSEDILEIMRRRLDNVN